MKRLTCLALGIVSSSARAGSLGRWQRAPPTPARSPRSKRPSNVKPRFYGFRFRLSPPPTARASTRSATTTATTSSGTSSRRGISAQMYLRGTRWRTLQLQARFSLTANVSGTDEANFSGSSNAAPPGTCPGTTINDNGTVDPGSVGYCNPSREHSPRRLLGRLADAAATPRIYTIPKSAININPAVPRHPADLGREPVQTLYMSLTPSIALGAHLLARTSDPLGYGFGFTKNFHHYTSPQLTPRTGGPASDRGRQPLRRPVRRGAVELLSRPEPRRHHRRLQHQLLGLAHDLGRHPAQRQVVDRRPVRDHRLVHLRSLRARPRTSPSPAAAVRHLLGRRPRGRELGRARWRARATATRRSSGRRSAISRSTGSGMSLAWINWAPLQQARLELSPGNHLDGLQRVHHDPARLRRSPSTSAGEPRSLEEAVMKNDVGFEVDLGGAGARCWAAARRRTRRARSCSRTCSRRPTWRDLVLPADGHRRAAHLRLMFIGQSSELMKIRFDIQENTLYARRAYEQIAGSEDAYKQDPAKYAGQPLAAWPITSQFDIIRDYNSTTGEETNKIIESTERPWNEREFIRVDWSKNQVTDYVGLGVELLLRRASKVSRRQLLGVGSDQAGRAAPRARGRQTNTEFAAGRGQLLRHHQQAGASPRPSRRVCYEENGVTAASPCPACFLRYQLDDCASQVVKVRHAFAKISPQARLPAAQLGRQADGAVRHLGRRPQPPDLQPPVRRDQHAASSRHAARFNIWKKSYQDDGKTPIPYASASCAPSRTTPSRRSSRSRPSCSTSRQGDRSPVERRGEGRRRPT